MSVPHILADESSAYYHAYVLAEMSVHQTRAHFKRKYAAMVDNPKVGSARLNRRLYTNDMCECQLTCRVHGGPRTLLRSTTSILSSPTVVPDTCHHDYTMYLCIDIELNVLSQMQLPPQLTCYSLFERSLQTQVGCTALWQLTV